MRFYRLQQMHFVMFTMLRLFIRFFENSRYRKIVLRVFENLAPWVPSLYPAGGFAILNPGYRLVLRPPIHCWLCMHSIIPLLTSQYHISEMYRLQNSKYCCPFFFYDAQTTRVAITLYVFGIQMNTIFGASEYCC